MLRAALAFLLLLASATVTLAAEQILLFRSEVKVETSGEYLVTETIRVNAEGVDIRRGIYRDFPITFQDDSGNLSTKSFELISATRDGATETARVERSAGLVRVYLGKSDVYLSPGVYTYVLKYKTGQQISFFDDHDEVYWNATGTEWAFPIEKAIAVIYLPDGASAQDTRAYTGAFGSQAQNARTMLSEGDNIVTFETIRPLAPREGLTVLVELGKGTIDRSVAPQFHIAYKQSEPDFSILIAIRMFTSFFFWFLP